MFFIRKKPELLHVSYCFLLKIFLFLFSDEIKSPKKWAKQHFMAEHLWNVPHGEMCLLWISLGYCQDAGWKTAVQVKGALLEVSGASFDLKIADCAWERDLDNPNSFCQTGLDFCGVFWGGGGELVWERDWKSCGFLTFRNLKLLCLSLGVVSPISFHPLPFTHFRWQWTRWDLCTLSSFWTSFLKGKVERNSFLCCRCWPLARWRCCCVEAGSHISHGELCFLG